MPPEEAHYFDLLEEPAVHDVEVEFPDYRLSNTYLLIHNIIFKGCDTEYHASGCRIC